MRPGRASAWACLAVLLAVAVVITAVSVQYAGQLPKELRFTNTRYRETTTWPTPLVLFGLWILCAILPLLAWYWFLTGSGRDSWSRTAFGTLAGITTCAGIFAATFILHHGADPADRAHDGLLAIAAGVTIGVIVHVLGPREHRDDLVGNDEESETAVGDAPDS